MQYICLERSLPPHFFTSKSPLLMENLLYLHGLDSTLSDVKRAILEKQFNVIAPIIDYRTDNVDEIIVSIFENNQIRAVVGSSIGGYVAYHISRQSDLPCLLFNPALFMRSVEIKFTELPKYPYYYNVMNIVLGKKDRVVSYRTTQQRLSVDNTIGLINFSLYSHLEHRIDLNTFDEEFNKFIESFDYELF